MEHASHYLVDYAGGKLQPGVKLQVDAHLRECPKCLQDLNEMTETLNQVSELRDIAPSNVYFASITPRVHEQLHRRASKSWIDSPIFSRLALPLAAAVIVVALLANIKGLDPSDSAQSPLAPVFEGIDPEVVVDIVIQDARPMPWTTRQAQEIAQAVVGDHLAREHFLQNALTLDFQPYLDEDSAISSQELIQGLDDAQIETLLKKLEERATL